MHLKFFCPRWGSEHLSFKDFLIKAKNSGYDGVEMSLPLDRDEKESILSAINDHGLLYMAQHWETTTGDFQEHKKEYRNRLGNLASANPVLINSQTGKDWFSFEQNAELINIASEVSDETGIKIIHETHRGKFSFAAHVTADYLSRLPGLRLGFDLSHWCNVAESYLEDQEQAVEMAISRADHIHARVGFPEGPQVPDPRVPEWQEAVNIHLEWWKRIILRNKNEGNQIFTITPEFGPFPYMTILPFTRQAITSQWEVNEYMMGLVRAEAGM